ncbi:MAG: Ig-like domain-containing protein, partial [Anaerolineales bacterium]
MIQKILDFISRHKLLMGVLGVSSVILAATLIILNINIMRSERGIPHGRTYPPLIISSDDEPTEFTGAEAGSQNLHVSLSMGQAQARPTEIVPIATGEPLSQEEIADVYARLPALTAEPDDQLDFKLPEVPLPPPRTGETITEQFPPSTTSVVPQHVEAGPLEVLRFSPEGEIPLAPFVNITFNQPMVPLTSLKVLTLEEVPVEMQPAIPGTWRWLGTKTLNFQADSLQVDRLPMATEYQVTIPAGTESAVGGILEHDVSWSFNTPPPKMIANFPYEHDPQPRDPLFFISFDQRINADPVLATIAVTADDQRVEIVQATEAEINRDDELSRLVENSTEGRWLVFKAKELLPTDALIRVVIGPGTPSAEGPVVTVEAQSYQFYTYAPLQIVRYECAWSHTNCPPLTPFIIEFNNPLDVDAYKNTMLRIDPPIPGAEVDIFGDTIHIRGITEGRTTYKVTVAKEIKDIFGQTLGEDTTLTFRVGSAEPLLTGPNEIMVTLDPSSRKPVFSVYSINYSRLHIRVYSVEPSDWPAYKEYIREFQRHDPPPKPPGKLVRDETISLNTPADVLSEVGIDLSESLDGEFGQFIVIIDPPAYLRLLDQNRYRHVVQAWVQVTQIGLDAFVDHSEMLVWATDLQNGAPLKGISIQTEPPGLKNTTGEEGTTSFDLPPEGIVSLVARRGDDLAMLPHSTDFWRDDIWSPGTVYDELRWYVFDDRAMYRPGEEVHVKGWMRRVGGRQDGDVGLVGSEVTNVAYHVVGPQGNDIADGHSEVNALGGFDFDFTIPENANLGYAQIHLEAKGSYRMLDSIQHQHNFQIQEFRRPEFEVSARNETTGPYFVGEHAVVAVEANYYAGGPLPNAEVNWQVTSSPSNYTPPNWPGFTFGIWQPWWYYEPVFIEEAYSPLGLSVEGTKFETFIGKTDATGEHFLRLDFDEEGQYRPFSVLAEATIFDVNRQAWAAATSLLVHPAELYVGLRSEKTFVERGEPLEIDLIVTDLDGNAVSGQPIKVTAARLDWKYSKGDWAEEEVDVQECLIESTSEPVTCTFETQLGGRYQVRADVTDETGRLNRTQFIRWVSGGQQPPARKVEKETVVLIPDKESYQPGDVANILVQAPFSPAEGLMTVSRSGFLYTERFLIDEATTTLQVPIEDKFIPNLHVQVDFAGEAPRFDDRGEILTDVPLRPAYASGQINLAIPPLQRTLSLQATPHETELEPGGETTIDLLLLDEGRKPVSGAELAVIVVDEAILALSDYHLADPVAVFYQHRPSDVSSYYSRASIVLADPEVLAEEARAKVGFDNALSATQMSEGMVLEEAEELAAAEPSEIGQAARPTITVRSDFNPLATFAPEVRTDVNGRAEVEVQLPDNLTRYRVMVVA